MSENHTLPSGAVLVVTPLSHEEAWSVTQTFLKTIETLNLDTSGLDLAAITAADVLKFKGPICAILGSIEIVEAVKKCFVKCTYNGVKIDSHTFEAPGARGDFIFAAFYVLKDNVSPFFGGVISLLKTS